MGDLGRARPGRSRSRRRMFKYLRDEAGLFLLKHEPRLAPRIIDTLADQIVDPLDGGHVSWDLIRR